ncbi:hypothetical protein [Calothrix sp. PCC 6303]|uniref:hypothetical protein n=1 Tax=Calothrix sp. PCC 6303 TaxID=1170562 RepID=UPI0002A00540|nr:hypothetical protein [Calothrix sp. PCC 6303]AFZ00113.1 hypothetical protein Cal6303_1050 [Calothrix sp. PCC 6303]
MQYLPSKKNQFLSVLFKASLIAATVSILSPSTASASGFYTVKKEYNLDFEKKANGEKITNSTAGNSLGIGNQWQDWGVKISANSKDKPNSSEPLVLFKSNSTSFTGGDNDLRTGTTWGTEEQGNVLIIQEDGWQTNASGKITGVKNADDPDDEANGGWITFDFFNAPVNLTGFSLLDMDDDQDSRGKFLEIFAWDKSGNEFKVDALSLIKGHKETHLKRNNGTYKPNSQGEGKSYTNTNAVVTNGQPQNQKSVTITQESSARGDNSLYSFSTEGFDDIVKLQYRYPGSGAIASVKWNKEEKRKVPEPGGALGFIIIASIFIRNVCQGKSSTSDC